MIVCIRLYERQQCCYTLTQKLLNSIFAEKLIYSKRAIKAEASYTHACGHAGFELKFRTVYKNNTKFHLSLGNGLSLT